MAHCPRLQDRRGNVEDRVFPKVHFFLPAEPEFRNLSKSRNSGGIPVLPYQNFRRNRNSVRNSAGIPVGINFGKNPNCNVACLFGPTPGQGWNSIVSEFWSSGIGSGSRSMQLSRFLQHRFRVKVNLRAVIGQYWNRHVYCYLNWQSTEVFHLFYFLHSVCVAHI